MRNIYTRYMTQSFQAASKVMKSSVPTKAKRPAKIRKNILLSAAVITMGKKLAALERRNFSNLVEMLIVREGERLEAA